MTWWLFRPSLKQRVAWIEQSLKRIEGDIMEISALALGIVDAVAAEKAQTAAVVVLLRELHRLVVNATNADDLAALRQAAKDLQADTQMVALAIQDHAVPLELRPV